MDDRTAIVWWDARTNPAEPHWTCEVPAAHDGGNASRAVLTSGAANWRGALDEARGLLDGLVADGE